VAEVSLQYRNKCFLDSAVDTDSVVLQMQQLRSRSSFQVSW